MIEDLLSGTVYLLALKRNTRYTPFCVTYATHEHNTGPRMGFADSPVAPQTDEPAREDLAQAAEAWSGGDQELGLRVTCKRKVARRLSMAEAGD